MCICFLNWSSWYKWLFKNYTLRICFSCGGLKHAAWDILQQLWKFFREKDSKIRTGRIAKQTLRQELTQKYSCILSSSQIHPSPCLLLYAIEVSITRIVMILYSRRSFPLFSRLSLKKMVLVSDICTNHLISRRAKRVEYKNGN